MAALKKALVVAALVWATPAAAQSVDRWAGEIAEASSRFAVPEEWIRRVIRVESGGRLLLNGKPVVSSAGAMGLMQLMPGTWRDLRALLGLGADPWNPHDNITAGTFYLRLMYDRFGYPGLFAAYNAGPARYAAFLEGGRALPSETRAYAAALDRLEPARPGAAAAPSLAMFVAAPGHLFIEARRPEPNLSSGLFVTLEHVRR